MGIAKRNKLIKIGYQLNKESLEELEKIMNELTETNKEKRITYSINFKDGKRVLDLTLEELLQRPNVGKEEITDISVGTIFYHSNSLIVTFKNNVYRPIYYELSVEDEKKLGYFENKIDTYAAGLKTTYSFFSISKFWFLAFVFLIVIAINSSFLIPGIVKMIPLFTGIPKSSSLIIILSSIVASISGILIGLGIEVTQKTYFPVGEFLIGNGIKRAERNNFVRITIILSLVLSLIVAYISNFF